MSVPTTFGQRAFACSGGRADCAAACFSVQHGSRCLGRAPVTAISKKPWKEHKDLNQACDSSCQCKFCEMRAYFSYKLLVSSVGVKYIRYQTLFSFLYMYWDDIYCDRIWICTFRIISDLFQRFWSLTLLNAFKEYVKFIFKRLRIKQLAELSSFSLFRRTTGLNPESGLPVPL